MSGEVTACARAALEAHARRAYGLVFPRTRASWLDRGIALACAALGLADADHLAQRLRDGDAGAARVFAEALTVGETYFFRDAGHFALARQHIAAVAAAHPRRVIRVWSAGCSTGEEAWSLAIAAREALGVRGFSRVRVLGTDLDESALEHARRGVYGRWSFRAGYTPDPRWFQREGDRWRVVDDLRRAVTFSRVNLVDLADDTPRDVDVVFCRNVLIYFDTAGVSTVAQRLARALAPGALLVAGPSDPPLAQHAPLDAEVTATGVHYRRADPAAQPSTPAPTPTVRAPREAPRAEQAPAATTARDSSPEPARPASTPATTHGVTASAPHDPLATLRALDDEIARAPLDPAGYLHRGTLRLDLCDPLGAAEDAARATLLDRRAPFAHILAAMAWHAAGEPGAARRHARNAASLLAGHDGGDEVPHARGLSYADARSFCAAMTRGRDTA